MPAAVRVIEFSDDEAGIVQLRLTLPGRNWLRGTYGPNAPKKAFMIWDLHVEKRFRGRGHGRTLIEAFEKFARSRGAKFVRTAMTEREAIPVWEHFGYVKKKDAWYWWKRL